MALLIHPYLTLSLLGAPVTLDFPERHSSLYLAVTCQCTRRPCHSRRHTHSKPVILLGQDRTFLLSAHTGQTLSGSPGGNVDRPGSRRKEVPNHE